MLLMKNLTVKEQYRSSKVKYSLMWWAKWFGIYHKERASKGIDEAHLDWNDMHINGFSLAESAGLSNGHEESSLDHDSNTCVGIGFQSDGYNCGVWKIMELFNCKDGCTKPVGIKTEMESNDYRLKLFNLLIHIYRLHEMDNDWLFK